MRSPEDSIWPDVLHFSLQMMEDGLRSFDATLKQVQSILVQLAGQLPATRPPEAPVEGPADLEAATSELANRLLRLVRASNRRPTSWWWDALDAASRSLPRDTLWNPYRWLTLPLQLPVAVSTLTVQEALHTLVTLEAVYPEVWGDFFEFVIEVFSDLHVYFSLHYGAELERYHQYLHQTPNDARAPLALGRTFMKCGLFREAVAEFRVAVQEPAVQRRAHYENLVANYRLGEYPRTIHHGVTCLEDDPTDARARYWLWLAAQKLGGYPTMVRQDLRMEVTAGYHSTAFEFEDVAAAIGLDKTSVRRGTAVFDTNGDGTLDVVIAGAHARFRNVTFAAGMPFTGKGHGANMADLAGDGRMHLIVATGGLYPGDLLTTTVFRPKQLPGNYLNVRLVGTRSNRDAIGARLKLHAGGREQYRLVSGGSSFGCLPYEQHFGLGTLTQIDWLEIRWPSGHVQRLAQLPLNQCVRIIEGTAGWEAIYANRTTHGRESQSADPGFT
jgi:tetratricopeptide (TPR) repeat protein